MNDAVTREVTKGELAYFVGMSHDGSKVDFTTTAQLVPEDEDTSSDMYQYDADTDQWTLVSQEGSLGSTDECSASWTEKCGVEPITPERIFGSEGYETDRTTPGPDDQIAIPEWRRLLLLARGSACRAKWAADGQRNLYLYHEGQPAPGHDA